MDDLDVLARDFGFGTRGKSNPMRSSQPDRQPIDDSLFSDVYGGPAKYSPSSNSNNNNNKHSSASGLNYDSIFNSSAAASEAKKTNNTSSNTSSVPVYDKPVYDDDIFDGLPGLKNKSGSSTVTFEDDVFASISTPQSNKSVNQNNDFDDLLGNLGRNEKAGENMRTTSAKSSSSSKGFDDLLAGFGSGSSASNRPRPEPKQGTVRGGGSEHGSVMNDPFVGLGASPTQGSSSSGVFTDPLQEISKLGKSRSARAEASSGGSEGFNDLDPLSDFGKPANSSSPVRDKRGRGKQDSPSFRYTEGNVEKKTPLDNFQEPPLFDMPNVSTDFQKSSGQAAASQYFETGSQVDMSPSSGGHGQRSDDIWLTVSEVPLFTQPTAAPPPSRPPPPVPRQTSRSEAGSWSSNSRKKGDEFSSHSYYSQHTQSPKQARPTTKAPPVSQFDELEDFAMGRSHNSIHESAREGTNTSSAAAASAAAMKDAMDKAEARFRHAKEVREREYAKVTRNKESLHMENNEDMRDREYRGTEEKFEHERKQKEDEEREQRRLEKERERSREIEREKAKQAVERAHREARERSAAQAREKASAEARLKAEKAAVERANAEARERAERSAVQRAQAEARGRAAAEAKERAEKAAAEARERAAGAEVRDKAGVNRAEADARRRAEKAAAERAAAEAQERAAAAAKTNQQRYDDDLESFFGMGRASSAPKGRANSTDPFSDQQFHNKGGSEAAKRTSSSSGASSNIKKASSTTNIVDDLSSIFGASPAAGEFQEVEGETEERRRARLERHHRAQERAAKALAEKNERDLQVQREQEERHRIAEPLDIEVKRWAAGKEGNLRAMLSTLQYVLWPECGWQPVSLTDLITGASVKKVYRKATLCIHPDKVQQKGATLQQKYIAEKVFDMLKEAWNKFNSEELF